MPLGLIADSRARSATGSRGEICSADMQAVSNGRASNGNHFFMFVNSLGGGS